MYIDLGDETSDGEDGYDESEKRVCVLSNETKVVMGAEDGCDTLVAGGMVIFNVANVCVS